LIVKNTINLHPINSSSPHFDSSSVSSNHESECKSKICHACFPHGKIFQQFESTPYRLRIQRESQGQRDWKRRKINFALPDFHCENGNTLTFLLC
jgi:hypothetical protein